MILIPLFAALLHAAEMPPPPLSCTVTPRVIEVGAFYSGAHVKIEGMAAAQAKIIVIVAGSDREESFNRKARFGPIWISAGQVRVSGVPSLFLRFSAEPVAAILSRDVIATQHLDEKSLMARMHIEPAPPDRAAHDALRADYVALKRSSGSYRFGNAGVVMGNANASHADDVPFAVQFGWPQQAPPATYQVRVYEVRDGAVLRRAAVPLAVVRAGFPAWLAELAENRASLYGLTAVLIAALAGFGIDLLTTRTLRKKRSVS